MSDLIGQPMAVNGVDGIVVEQDPARGRVLVNFPGEPVRQEWVDLGGASGAAEAGTTERSEIVEMMARTLFVTLWADQEEEEGRHYPGQDLMDVAPPTTPHARSAAIDLAANIEKLNGMTLDALYHKAENTDGQHTRVATPRDFGYSLAMMALGHGVSWFDDHPEFPLEVPDVEYYAGMPSANEAAAPPQTKQGKHGQLYHYRFVYTDKDDTGFGEQQWSTWAYNQEHAIEKFYSDGDESWKALRIARLPSEGVRMTWHKLAEATSANETHRGQSGYSQITTSARVTIVDRFGKEHTGRAVMHGPHGWVLNMGGAHGTPSIATPENTVKVTGGSGHKRGIGEEANEADITVAQRARVEQSLSKQVRLPSGEVVTTREFLNRLRAEGGVLKTFRERQYKKEDEVRRKIEQAGRNAPFGNVNHPDTIAFNREKSRLEASLTKERTGVQLPDGRFFELNKTELDYFTNAATESPHVGEEAAKSTRTYRVMLNSNKSLHLVEAKSIKEARSKALAQYGSDFNGLVYEVENRNGVWASLRRTGAREEATPNTPERQREQEWMWKPYSVSVQFKRADGSTYYNRLGFDDEDTAISAGAKLSMGPDVETVFVKANGGREVWSWWPGKQAEETPRSMREDNVILTNDQGRPIEKPRREDFPSDVKYIHSFHAYRDRVASAANIGFGEGFRKAMRGAHEARPGGIDPTSGYAQAWRRIQAYVDATRPGYEVDSAVIPAGDGRWQFAIRPRTGGRWETVIAPNAEIDRVSQATYVSEEAPRGGPVDEDALVELQLYADNTAELYPQKQAIIANISRRIKNGSYNPALAPQLWSYWVDEAAKRYSKEFGLTTFNKATREELARRLAEEEYAELRVQSGATEGIAEETRYRSAGPNSYFVEVYTADGRTIKFDERVSRERAFADAIDILKNGLVMHGESKGQNGRIDVRGLKVIQMRSGSARGKGGASEAEARDFSTLKDLLIGAKAKGAQYVKKATAADAKRIETDEGVHVSHLVYFKANGRWVVRPVFQAEGLAHLGSFGVLVSGISVDAVKIDDAITDMEKVLYADEGVAHGAGEAPGLNWHGQPWDDSFIVAPDAKKKFGDRRAYQYMPFYLLSPSQKAQIKQGRWPHGSFYDEHYFYPRKKDGTLMHARRVLAIPYALIGDEPFMKSIGYEKTIEGKMWQQAQEPIDASEAGERALVIHEEASDHHRKVTSWLQKKKLSLDWADSIWDVPPWEGRDKRKNHTTLLMHDLEIPGYRDSTEMRVKVDDFVAYAKKHAPPPPPVYDIDESMSQEAHGGGRMAELRAELPMGFTVETYSPGDGITRYRFFENAAPNQDYFGPGNGMHTALGYKKAFLYAQSLHDYAKNLTIPQKTHLAFNKVKSSFTLPKAPGAEEVPLMAPLGPMAGGCLPWVRVTRDPERYGACLAVAQKIGPITDARKVYDLLHEPLMKEDQEVFIVILCDVQGQLRGVTEVHRGGRSRVGVAVSDVMRVVLATGAEMYLVCHGHPSGKARPSEADRHLTKEIQKATKLYGSEITFVDHVVIGHKQFYSIVEDKLFKV